jgi:hypothetical protein
MQGDEMMRSPKINIHATEVIVGILIGVIIGVSCAPATITSLPPTTSNTSPPTKENPTPTSLPTKTPFNPTATPESKRLEIAVPGGREARIDGVLSAEEWASAYQTELAGGGELLLMHREGYLYLGVRAKPEPVTSICVDQGARISVLHSSAALGTAIYQQGADGWQRIREFDWCCRETADSPQAQEHLSEQLEQDNWVASNGRMGAAEEVEFKIGMPEGRLRLAVASIGAPDYEEIAWWPLDMSDDCRNPRMIRGEIPDQAQFAVGEWMILTASIK